MEFRSTQLHRSTNAEVGQRKSIFLLKIVAICRYPNIQTVYCKCRKKRINGNGWEYISDVNGDLCVVFNRAPVINGLNKTAGETKAWSEVKPEGLTNHRFDRHNLPTFHLSLKDASGPISIVFETFNSFSWHMFSGLEMVWQRQTCLWWAACIILVLLIITIVGFTRIAVNFKFHSWFANFKLT